MKSCHFYEFSAVADHLNRSEQGILLSLDSDDVQTRRPRIRTSRINLLVSPGSEEGFYCRTRCKRLLYLISDKGNRLQMQKRYHLKSHFSPPRTHVARAPVCPVRKHSDGPLWPTGYRARVLFHRQLPPTSSIPLCLSFLRGLKVKFCKGGIPKEKRRDTERNTSWAQRPLCSRTSLIFRSPCFFFFFLHLLTKLRNNVYIFLQIFWSFFGKLRFTRSWGFWECLFHGGFEWVTCSKANDTKIVPLII